MSKYSKAFDRRTYDYIDKLDPETGFSENVTLEDSSIKLDEEWRYDEDIDDIVERDCLYAIL